VSAKAILFPAAKGVVLDYLGAELAALGDDATVAGYIPEGRPARLVRVLRTGGAPATSIVYGSAQLTLDCWDDDDVAAEQLVDRCRALVLAMPDRYVGPETIYRADELAAPAEQPDPDTRSPRYVWSVVLGMRGSAI
jgi:hypothetical protein